ncbi:hypothetical protein TBLA_0G03080 [Henningerozyma blattae CBS 6284]|uniref:Uncharacterized protein n=1 Tax=Henningerozyma blattae (strain ATCC 34711 / CBS 6284 / DSM 70876 / NBRC 10599 / NRRL Y-10934 / UCD 77-7) TaxID=1071380 RepID=I2H793_HENB6|nr:hypothetical protein TBLA_0G03080 [Tetrapisispora blattae CBS 6284]CCH62245.1 hypothetical protein TBLA_0G03080 [Tetrapisispora blattae CBS 6284]
MNKLDYTRFCPRKIDYTKEFQLQLERIFEGNVPKLYKLRQRKNIESFLTCLDLDSEANEYLLIGKDDGSVELWDTDDRLTKNDTQYEVVNRRINFYKGTKTGNEIPTHSVSSSSNHRLIHSYTSNNRAYRMYRGSSSSASPSSSSSIQKEGSSTSTLSYHQYSINSILWYPRDNGMFFTGSGDRCVKIWDTNRFSPVQSVDLRFAVNEVSCSTNNVLGIASQDTVPRLIDLREAIGQGAITMGSRSRQPCKNALTSIQFNPVPSREHFILTGDRQSDVRLWDLRVPQQELAIWPGGTAGIAWEPEKAQEFCSMGTDGWLRIRAVGSDGSGRNSDHVGSGRVVGPRDPLRVSSGGETRKHTGRRITWCGNMVLCHTALGTVEAHVPATGRLWRTLEAEGIATDGAAHTGGLALQGGLGHPAGLRLFLGCGSTLVDCGGCSVEG